jgi:hypothetical protein
MCAGLRDGHPKNNGKRFGVIARELSSIRAVALRQGAQHSLGGHPLIEQGSFSSDRKIKGANSLACFAKEWAPQDSPSDGSNSVQLGAIGLRPPPPAYDCFSIVNAIVVPRCLSVYSALIDLPSLDTVMR